MIVIDTNVVSELMKRSPADGVVRWVAAHPSSSLYVTTITQAEILYGIRILPAGKRRTVLEAAATEMFRVDFAGRVLAFGEAAAIVYAEIAATRRRAGRPISHFDAQIAAIARVSGALLATRNVTDFNRCGIRVVDPWEA